MKKLITLLCMLTALMAIIVTPLQASAADTGKIYGDANNDGVVNIEDVSIVQRNVAEIVKRTEINVELADVNGDGKITILDATYLQSYLVGILDEFPVESIQPTTQPTTTKPATQPTTQRATDSDGYYEEIIKP